MSYRLVLGALAAAGLHSAAATALPSPAAAAMIEPGDAQLRGYDAFVRAGALQIAIAPDRLAVCPRARPAACVAMAIDGAAPYRWPEFGRPQRSRSHYLRGSDPAHWRVGVPHYGLLRYREVLPGVDWVLRTDGARLRYDFELQPGADPGRIRLRFTGARPALDDDSALVLDTPAGRLRHSDLNVFRVTVPGRQPVPARFRPAGDGVVEFDLRGAEAGTALLIDPLLEYSSYLGGSGTDGAHDVTTDDDGYVYVVGGTDSADFPLASPLQPALAGAEDGYVAKFTPDGAALVWATYIGGSGAERLTAIALAADGSIALGGWTQSADFPTLAAFQSTFAGGDNNQDAVVLKLKPPGDALEFSSYLGGLDTNVYPEEVRGIAVDTTGAIHVTGSTGARSFPVTVPFLGRGCLLDDAAIGLDAFYTRVSASGALLASTCLGGAGWDVGRAVALGPNNTIHVAGWTRSANFPATAGAYQTALDGTRDAWIGWLRADLSVFEYATYFGGGDDEFLEDIALDDALNVYATGATYSSDFPATAGSAQPAPGGPLGIAIDLSDAYVAKLDPTLSSLIFASFLGGAQSEIGWEIGRDSLGHILIGGHTGSAAFPLAIPFQPAWSGLNDGFVAAFKPDGLALVYSSYLGGSDEEFLYGLRVDRSDRVWLAGLTFHAAPADFPLATPFQAAALGLNDSFLTRIASIRIFADGFE